MFQKCENTMYLRFAHDLGSGKAKRLCANAIVAPIVSSVNVRSTDILQRETNKKQNQIITIVFKRKSQHLKLRQFNTACKFHSKTISLDPNEYMRELMLAFRLHLCSNSIANANANSLHIGFHSSIIYISAPISAFIV